ncbi:MAG: transcriptional repressor [Planctomycetes bacterium]|jgi:Fur family ferric uptake transcriptional regulator|nr:transcriptional repressor [Planctomycetota bacterium]
MRKTSQRQAIRNAFADAGRPLSVPEALDEAQREVPGMGPATVYRAVNALVDDGFLKAVELPGEPARYELAELGHHHHFHCKACGKVFDVQGCPGKLGQLAPPGFEVASHEIILYGRCAQCVEADEDA